MGAISVLRIVLHVLATLILLTAIGFVTAGVATAAWQQYEDPGTHEKHLHGLWIDFTYAKMHAAGSASDKPQWSWSYKFGAAVKGDEAHRAQPYQVNTLILLVVGTLLALLALFFSFCAPCLAFASIGWALSILLATLLSISGVIVFYLTAMMPEHRQLFVGRTVEQVIGYSYYMAVIGTGGYALGMMLSVACAILTFIAARTAQKQPGKTYPKINHAHNTVV